MTDEKRRELEERVMKILSSLDSDIRKTLAEYHEALRRADRMKEPMDDGEAAGIKDSIRKAVPKDFGGR